MTDDLVKRLRGEHVAASRTEAADRIEALEAELREARMQSLAALGQAGEAHAAQIKAEADRDALAERMAQAREAAALRKAAEMCEHFANTELTAASPTYADGYCDGADRCEHAILALITPDAQSALDSVVREAVLAEQEACARRLDLLAKQFRADADAVRETHPAFAEEREEYADDVEIVAAAIRARGET